MSFEDRSRVGRVSAFLVDRVAPHLPAGNRSGRGPSRADYEREASEELQARIALGRPGPEEARHTAPRPAWARPRPRASRPLDVFRVRLDDVVQASGSEPAPPTPAARPRRLTHP